MLIGYARVSTKDQNLELQWDALTKSGCEMIFQEKASGIKTDRPELAKMMSQLRNGDVVCIYKLDRLGRSLKNLLELVAEFEKRGVGLRSLTDSIDTTTPQGRLVLNIFASLAEFERDLIRERTKAGLEAARARGRKGGRRSGLSAEAQKKAMLAEMYYKEEKLGVDEIAKTIGVSKMTLYKYLRLRGVPISAYQSKTGKI
ncbi:recombinase family protein [Runella sp.]|jgi:DNA invertase Pin-like site-specific DNA recombinase|uniref:recombinase family protein n=1 Tax=Runella sp. TaxID=1960881 RepID=UPI00301791E9